MKDYIRFRLSKLELTAGKSQMTDLLLDIYKELKDHDYTVSNARKMIREVLSLQIKQVATMLQILQSKND